MCIYSIKRRAGGPTHMLMLMLREKRNAKHGIVSVFQIT
jgi:hypothetical protein